MEVPDKTLMLNSENDSEENKEETNQQESLENGSSPIAVPSPIELPHKSRRSNSLTARLRSFSFQKNKDGAPLNKEPRHSFSLRPRSATFFKFSSSDNASSSSASSSPDSTPPTPPSRSSSPTTNDISGSLIIGGNSPSKRTPVFIRLDMKKLSDIDMLSRSHTLHTITKSSSSPSIVRNRGLTEEMVIYHEEQPFKRALSSEQATLKLQSIYRGVKVRRKYNEKSTIVSKFNFARNKTFVQNQGSI